MIERIHHIGIAVASISEGRLFYEALGLRVERVEDVPREGVRVAFMTCGESAIELLEPLGGWSPVARFLDRRGPGIHHVCFATPDVDGEQLRLREAGFEVLKARPERGAGGCWIQFVHPRSAGGVLVELAQHPESKEH